DLTRTGLRPDEFVVGRDYFEATWPNPQDLPTRRYGLGLGRRNILTIPGNHDHWDGDTRNQWGYNAAVKTEFFTLTPFVRQLTSGRLIVEFCGVDSGSGFPPLGAGRNRRARGRISRDEMDALNRLLAASYGQGSADRAAGIRRVRVIVCHHSFQGCWP